MKVEEGLEKVIPQISVPQQAMVEVAMTRAAQEVQAAMVIAKRFPRNETEAFARIMKACKRPRLAKESQYAYPRGGSKVTGPSIRLAEVIQQNWGNMESGIIELERQEGRSVAMAYAWDLESNSRDVKVFTIEHVRDRSEQKGGSVTLTDNRDIYELVANQGARRKRACILAVIPGDIVDEAVEECDKTLKGDNSEPLEDRIRNMVVGFSEIAVTKDMLEKRVGHTVESMNETELVSIGKVFISLRDGMSKREDWFEIAPGQGLQEGKQAFGFKAKKAEEKKPEEKAKSKAQEPEKPAPAPEPAPEPKPPVEEPKAQEPPPPPVKEPTPEPAPPKEKEQDKPSDRFDGDTVKKIQFLMELCNKKKIPIDQVDEYAREKYEKSIVRLDKTQIDSVTDRVNNWPLKTPFHTRKAEPF